MENLLTVIVFTYNHKKLIRACLDSIVGQKTSYPYEVHLWDDASTDGTSDVCREYAEKYPDKIKLTVQPENTFLKPYEQIQSLAAIRSINTKYFCIIDGDDCWCDENKIQLGLDFLESHPEYVGWAHDTYIVNAFDNTKKSYIHDDLHLKTVENPVVFSDKAPFLLTSSRIFKNLGYADKNILPVDYLVYYWHLSQGPVFYDDKIMAVYNIGCQNIFANKSDIKEMNSMFAYKLSLLFDFKQDGFCTDMQKKYDTSNKVSARRYENLCLLKKLFGIKLGWRLWFFMTFVCRYGIECMSINYVCSHKKIKKSNDLHLRKRHLEKRRKKQIRRIGKIETVLNNKFLCLFFSKRKLEKSLARKRVRIEKINNELGSICSRLEKK